VIRSNIVGHSEKNYDYCGPAIPPVPVRLREFIDCLQVCWNKGRKLLVHQTVLPAAMRHRSQPLFEERSRSILVMNLFSDNRRMTILACGSGGISNGIVRGGIRDHFGGARRKLLPGPIGRGPRTESALGGGGVGAVPAGHRDFCSRALCPFSVDEERCRLGKSGKGGARDAGHQNSTTEKSSSNRFFKACRTGRGAKPGISTPLMILLVLASQVFDALGFVQDYHKSN